MLDKVYLRDFDKVKDGDICYGKSGEPMRFLGRDGDRVKLLSDKGDRLLTDISSIKLLKHEHYQSFRWITPPGARIASAASKGISYHPRQLIAVGEWYNPITETLIDGSIVNKRVDNNCGLLISIPDIFPVIWVDDSKIDLSYLPASTESVDNIPQQIKPYTDVTKAYIDIETTGLDPSTDRVTMIGVRNHLGDNFIFTSIDESTMLTEAMGWLNNTKPDLIFMHNGYNFDVPFLITRCELNNISHPFSECDRQVWRQVKTTAHPVLRKLFDRNHDSPEYGGKMTAYEAFDGGTTIIDTMISLGLWDVGKKLPNLKLKASVINLKLRDDTRLELTNDEIQSCWQSGNLDRLIDYLIFDLEDTQLLADFLMPNIWYQQAYIPDVKLMDLVHKNTGFKIQKMYESLCQDVSPNRDSKADYGGGLTGAITGIYHDVAKIDVASLYPSLMVRYRLGSRKDVGGRYIDVLGKMLTDRLEYKRLGKAGDKNAAGMAEAIKLLMNSGYGCLGNQGYSFNDMENAALITAHGRVVLRLMCRVIEDNDGILCSIDTDGAYFSHSNPQVIFDEVTKQLPSKISIELEKQNLVMFSRSKKNYCLYSVDGLLVDMKGNSFLTHQCPIEATFTKEYPRLLITEGQLKADKYYKQVIEDLSGGITPIKDIAIKSKILANWGKKMELLGITEPTTVEYYYCRHDHHPLSRNYSRCRKYKQLETQIDNYPSIPYFGGYYAHKIDCLRSKMLGIPESPEWWAVIPKK